jgi:hypothetical protein
MAWRTGQRICSAPNAFWCLSRAAALKVLLLDAVLAVSLMWGQSPGPSNVGECRPCSFSPGGSLPAYSFTFDLKTVPEGRAVVAIAVDRDSKPVQRLPVAGMEPIGAEEQFFFGGVDLNFDGLLDLMLITRKGVANAYAEYWLFDSKTAMFTALGTYPVFRVDVQNRRLTTYERGGSAGLIYEAKEYAFLEGKLTLVRDEKQNATQQRGVFRKVVRERIGGVMKATKSETVRAPK